jgi:hypothetical protein
VEKKRKIVHKFKMKEVLLQKFCETGRRRHHRQEQRVV